MFAVEIGERGEVRLNGRLDASQADAAQQALSGVVQSITADCSGLEYISSAGISVLIHTYKRLHGLGMSLKLVNLAPRVRNVFVYAGLDKLLQIE